MGFHSFWQHCWLRVLSLTLVIIYPSLHSSHAEADELPVIKYSKFNPACIKCRRYELRIFPSGQIVYEGTVRYKKMGFVEISLENGLRETTIASDVVQKWVSLLLQANFFELSAEYIDTKNCSVERADQMITLSLNNKSNAVKWYWCLRDGFPSEIHQVSREILQNVNPNQWAEMTK